MKKIQLEVSDEKDPREDKGECGEEGESIFGLSRWGEGSLPFDYGQGVLSLTWVSRSGSESI